MVEVGWRADNDPPERGSKITPSTPSSILKLLHLGFRAAAESGAYACTSRFDFKETRVLWPRGEERLRWKRPQDVCGEEKQACSWNPTKNSRKAQRKAECGCRSGSADQRSDKCQKFESNVRRLGAVDLSHYLDYVKT
eukprot:331874-Amorphochlora_amoeboformis.AAC.2